MENNEKQYLINFLIDKLNEDYRLENNIKERFESKALGYYTIFGIILANVIAIQIIISLRFRHGGEKITNLC